jgi:hypothetical protein
MDDLLLKQKVIARRIIDLSSAISSWSATNSQSNPGAVMELRAMKRNLEKAYHEFNQTMVEAARIRKPGDVVESQ